MLSPETKQEFRWMRKPNYHIHNFYEKLGRYRPLNVNGTSFIRSSDTWDLVHVTISAKKDVKGKLFYCPGSKKTISVCWNLVTDSLYHRSLWSHPEFAPLTSLNKSNILRHLRACRADFNRKQRENLSKRKKAYEAWRQKNASLIKEVEDFKKAKVELGVTNQTLKFSTRISEARNAVDAMTNALSRNIFSVKIASNFRRELNKAITASYSFQRKFIEMKKYAKETS